MVVVVGEHNGVVGIEVAEEGSIAHVLVLIKLACTCTRTTYSTITGVVVIVVDFSGNGSGGGGGPSLAVQDLSSMELKQMRGEDSQ